MTIRNEKGVKQKLHIGGTTLGSLDRLFPHAGAWNPIASM
jgi:hypothetical protein